MAKADRDDALSGGRSELWSLREDVDVELEPDDGPVRLYGPWGNVTIQRPSPQVRQVLHRMRLGPIQLKNVVGDDDSLAARQLHGVLDRLQPWIVRSLGWGNGRLLLSVMPLTPRSRFQPKPLPPDEPVRLSAFAELRTDGHEYRLESPLSLHRVLLHRPEAVWLVATLSQPVTPAVSVAALPAKLPAAAEALAYLVAAGMVVRAHAPAGVTRPPVSGDTRPPLFGEDTDPALVGWSPVDLMFHTRSTTGRHDNHFGITYPLGESESPEPVVKRPLSGTGIPLYRPRWDDLCTADPPLTVAIEARRSIRTYGAEPMTVDELGAILYRAARVRALLVNTPDGREEPGAAAAGHGLSDRPYPNAGACYELELYVTVARCTGLAAGVYHYDPLEHRLEPLEAHRATADELLRSAQLGAAMDTPPPVLITLTARFQRLSWKYQGFAYALVLLNAGVMIHNLYLICTAMRLARCAVGSVPADLTARAFGTDWRVEPGIAQFVVGRAPSAASRPGAWQPVNDSDWADRAMRACAP